MLLIIILCDQDYVDLEQHVLNSPSWPWSQALIKSDVLPLIPRLTLIKSHVLLWVPTWILSNRAAYHAFCPLVSFTSPLKVTLPTKNEQTNVTYYTQCVICQILLKAKHKYLLWSAFYHILIIIRYLALNDQPVSKGFHAICLWMPTSDKGASVAERSSPSVTQLRTWALTTPMIHSGASSTSLLKHNWHYNSQIHSIIK